jgi:hypothetical protein
MRLDDRIDLGPGLTNSSVTAFLSKHAQSAARIAEGISEYDIPSLGFLRLSLRDRKNISRSFSKNLVLHSTLLSPEDRIPRRRYASEFITPLFEEFPDGGLFKSALYAMFHLRAEYPESAYMAQIGQSYLEFAFFAYGVYFETNGRILSLRLFENLLEAYDKFGVDFTDGIKLYKLQTFIEKTAEGQSPFYNSERRAFEDLSEYSEDDFRAIPSERIFPMDRHDPEDWKASQIPLHYSKTEAERFRLVAREFIESRDELDSFVSEKEFFRFQNVSCAKRGQPAESSKLRQEVRSGYEMDDKPFQFKRTLINVSTSNYRDSWVNTPESRAKLKYFEILTRRMIRNVPEIPDGDMEHDGYAEHFRYAHDHTYVMGDLKKWGITFPVYLIRIFCEEAEKRFPFGWVTLAEQLENATLWVDGEAIPVGKRGFGLGNLNYMSSVIHYLILKMTNADKFVVRSDDSLTSYKSADNPHYEIHLKEQLGFIVNRKKVNISSKANVFCENYAEIESKFQSQIYEKLGYMTAQIGGVMRKVCNSLSAKYFISTACDIDIPAKSLIDFLVAINYMIFGPEFDTGEIKFDHHCGGWTKKYYSTNMKTEYIALEEDVESIPEYTALIKALYHNQLAAIAPSESRESTKEYYPLLRDKVFPHSQVEKENLESEFNVLIPFQTPFEFVQELNDQLAQTQRLNKNAYLRTRKWEKLQRRRQKVFSKLDISRYYDIDMKTILLERIEKNFLDGKGGYAIPYSIFPEEDYKPQSVLCLGPSLGSEGAIVRLPHKPVSLEEEDRQMTEFLKEIRAGRLPVDRPRFDLWKESKHVLYSMNEYGNGILVTEEYQEIIKKNEKFLAFFNVPTEIAYFDWCTRLALKGDSDVYRTDFSFETPDKNILYRPDLFKRYAAFPGPDPKRLSFYGCHFYVSHDDFQIITHGLKLMKYLPEYEQEVSNLFNLLYKEGIVSPDFRMRREEIIAELAEAQQKKNQQGENPADDELLLELLQWRSEIAAQSLPESLSKFEEDMLLNDFDRFVTRKTTEQNLEDFDESKLLSLFDESELAPPVIEEESDEEPFDFSYDYDDNHSFHYEGSEYEPSLNGDPGSDDDGSNLFDQDIDPDQSEEGAPDISEDLANDPDDEGHQDSTFYSSSEE